MRNRIWRRWQIGVQFSASPSPAVLYINIPMRIRRSICIFLVYHNAHRTLPYMQCNFQVQDKLCLTPDQKVPPIAHLMGQTQLYMRIDRMRGRRVKNNLTRTHFYGVFLNVFTNFYLCCCGKTTTLPVFSVPAYAPRG